MKIVIKEPYKQPYVKDIEDKLEAYQEIVGGYIEVILFTDNILIVCNEEGKLMGLEPNIYLRNDIIVGTIFFVGRREEDFRGLTDNEIKIIFDSIV